MRRVVPLLWNAERHGGAVAADGKALVVVGDEIRFLQTMCE
ncbi:hypothetical protein [Mycolicibacterium psychrotolerans]|nr:hypothetical protein [Mycolicibacterium psychrotolerans]